VGGRRALARCGKAVVVRATQLDERSTSSMLSALVERSSAQQGKASF